MARFGVGRPAVREALFLLQQQGRIEIASGARARVTAPTPAILIQQLASSSSASPDGRAARNIWSRRGCCSRPGSPGRRRRARPTRISRGCGQALDANVAALGNVGEFIRTDVAFHYELARITRNPVFNAVHEILVEWLIDQRTTTIHMPDADQLSVRDHTAIYEAVAARDPARAFHEMASHLRLISRLYSEAKRLSETILRDVTRDVAKRIEQENEAMWAASFGGAAARRGREAMAGSGARRRGEGGGA